MLDVELPASRHGHCRRQRFYFERSGRLVRHDYHAEIIGAWARGAHFWRRETRRGGFPISLERYVAPRLGPFQLGLPALHATFIDARVDFR